MTDDRDLRFRALREPFANVQQVTKKWKDKQGMQKSITLDYIGHAVVTNRLLEVDPAYSFAPLLDENGRPIVVLDGLGSGDTIGVWGKLSILGTEVVEFCGGTNLLDAYSRCLCRAAMRRGVALDLWIKDDEFKEVRKEGGLGDMPVPRSWAKVKEWYELAGGKGAWPMAEAFHKAAMYHLYGETESKALTPDQRKVLLQKAAGAVVWLAENPNTPLGPTASVEHYQNAWASVLGGFVLTVPDAPAVEDEDEVERLAKLAEETITGPPA